MYLHTFILKYTYSHIYAYVCTRIQIHTYTHTQTHINMYLHAHTHTRTHAHTHTHTHIMYKTAGETDPQRQGRRHRSQKPLSTTIHTLPQHARTIFSIRCSSPTPVLHFPVNSSRIPASSPFTTSSCPSSFRCLPSLLLLQLLQASGAEVWQIRQKKPIYVQRDL